MDDFKEMMDIEQEFGALELGFLNPNLQNKPKKKPLKEEDESKWKLFANKITNTPAKFQ